MKNQYMKTQTVSILDYIHHRVILSALPQSALFVRFWTACCGHIVIAGSFSALVRRILENSAWQGAGNWFRKSAGAMIGILGLYFILTPLVS